MAEQTPDVGAKQHCTPKLVLCVLTACVFMTLVVAVTLWMCHQLRTTNLQSNEMWLPQCRARSAARCCIMLTTYATPERVGEYKTVLQNWLRANMQVPIYVVDSAGLNLLRANAGEKYTYVCFQQPPDTLKRSGPSLLERASIYRLLCEHPEIAEMDMVFKVTGKYFIPGMDAIIARVPPDTDMVLQHRRAFAYHSQNTEVVGMRPFLLLRTLSRVTGTNSWEKTTATEIHRCVNLKVVRLRKIRIAAEHRVRRSNRSILTYL